MLLCEQEDHTAQILLMPACPITDSRLLSSRLDIKMAPGSEICIFSEKCSGCLLCALACSFYRGREGSFSLTKAHIEVNRVRATHRFEVKFRGSCDRCGICAGYCLGGALVQGGR